MSTIPIAPSTQLITPLRVKNASATLLVPQRATVKCSYRSSIATISQTTGWVDHTHEVIADAEELLASAVDMETGMRGYLLAGKFDSGTAFLGVLIRPSQGIGPFPTGTATIVAE